MYHITVITLFMMFLTGNHYGIVGRMGNGDNDREFKLLADWYTHNVKDTESVGTTMTGTLSMMQPRASYVRIGATNWHNLDKLAQKCVRQKLDYVTWDSRNGYGRANPRKIHPSILSPKAPKSVGPFEFVIQLKWNPRQYINVFRFHNKPMLPRSLPEQSP